MFLLLFQKRAVTYRMYMLRYELTYRMYMLRYELKDMLLKKIIKTRAIYDIDIFFSGGLGPIRLPSDK